MDNHDENRTLPLFCLLDILFTRGHRGLPGFPPVHWLDCPNEFDWLQYICIIEECGCLTVPKEVCSDVFNRVFHMKTVGAEQFGQICTEIQISSYQAIPKKSHRYEC